MNKHIPTVAAAAVLLSALSLAYAQSSQDPTAVPPAPPASANGDATTVTQPSGKNATMSQRSSAAQDTSATSDDMDTSSRTPKTDRN